MWRWNLNGFGHGTKKAGDPDFTWEANVALTMDGEVVAEKGSIAGFGIFVNQTIGGFLANSLYAHSDKGFVQIAFSESSGDSTIRLHQGNNEVYLTPTQIVINGMDVQTSINSAFNNIGNLNDYIKSVDNARIDDYNTLHNLIEGNFNLIKTLHGL